LKTCPHLRHTLRNCLPHFQFRKPKSEIENQKSKILVEPLSQRELESTPNSSRKDFRISENWANWPFPRYWSTVKGHSRIIFDKLQSAQIVTEAGRSRRELGLL